MDSDIDCGKKSYTSHHKAEITRKTLYRNRSCKLRIYQCNECHLWHLTSNARNLDKTKNKRNNPYPQHDRRFKVSLEDY